MMNALFVLSAAGSSIDSYTEMTQDLITCESAPGTCGTPPPPSYEGYLWTLPTVSLTHQADALAIATPLMGICPTDITHTSWVIGGIKDPQNNGVSGVEIGCAIWVAWLGAQWTSGAASDGPTISYTAFAHEIAHCALQKQGQDDPNHTRAEWWGPNGKVAQANAALAAAGI